MELTHAQLDASAVESFLVFAARVFRIVEPSQAFEYNWHVDCIAEHLEASLRGELPRLIINIPPRCLKSYLVSIAYPAWVLGKQPHHKFIVTSYSAEVVEDAARKSKQIIKDDWYKHVFPETQVSQLIDRNNNFETTKSGQYYAASALSSITGKGCDTMIIDDPVKPMEAYSDDVRVKTNQNIRSTLLNRFNDHRTGRFIMIMQRLHEDDPTGNLLKDGGYYHLKLPAETKHPLTVKLGGKSWKMKAESLLFPTRLGREELDRICTGMTELHYAGQFLQEPIPIGGGEFRDDWVRWYEPGTLNPHTMNICILCDPAGGVDTNEKKKKTSDYTAMMVVGLAPDNNYYLLDMVRDRLNPTERIDTLFQLHRKWNAKAGKPPKVGYEKYGMMSDTHYLKEKQKQESYRFPVIELGGKVMKEERIRRLIPDMQQLRWYFPTSMVVVDKEGRRPDLVHELIYSEMPPFPLGRYDDMLDALSRVYDVEMLMLHPQLISKKEPHERQRQSQSWMDY